MMGSRLAMLIEQYGIRIQTPKLFQRPSISINYTLFYEDRSLEGAMYTEQTITCEKALGSAFTLAHQQDVPELKRIARQTEKRLRVFLASQFEEFQQAILADRAEAEQGQFIEIRPDPKELPDKRSNEGGTYLTRLFSQDLSFGMRIVYCDSSVFPKIYVGRVEEVHLSDPVETVVTGRTADVVLLQADNHEQLANAFFQMYFYCQPEPPAPGVYAWPGYLQPQTFQKRKRPGHLVSFQMKLPYPIGVIVLSSDDFDNHEENKETP